MPTVINGNPALWPVGFFAPSDGDAPFAASVDAGLEALAHRTANNHAGVAGNAEDIAAIVTQSPLTIAHIQTKVEAGPLSVTAVAGAPPAASAPTDAYVFYSANASASVVIVEFSFDLRIASNAIAGYVAFDIKKRLASGGAGTSIVCGGALLKSVASTETYQRVHVKAYADVTVTPDDLHFTLYAGRSTSFGGSDVQIYNLYGQATTHQGITL